MSSEIFRDRTDGVIARRLDLLRRRRDELITMPHAVRRVVVDRSARIAASIVAGVGGVAMLAAAALPAVYKPLESAFPGNNPAVLSQLVLVTWVVAIFVYAMARSRAEHRFIVTMSKCVLPGEDIDHDIERLSHEHPDAIAKGMAQRLEVRSAALPVLAAALILPATALYVIDSVREGGWSKYYEYTLFGVSWWLIAFGVLGLVLAALMTRRRARMPLAGTIAASVAAIAALGLPVLLVQSRTLPVWILPALLLSTTIAVIVRRLRIERGLIDAIDPAAGSELFSWRKSMASLRTWVTRISPRAWAGAGAFVALLVVGGEAFSLQPQQSVVATPAVAAVVAPAMPAMDHGELTKLAASPQETVVEVDIHGGIAKEMTGIAGLDSVPAGWKMRAVVRQLEPSPGDAIVRAVGFGIAERRRDHATGTTISIIELGNCGTASPLAIRVEPQGTWSGRITLAIRPTLVYSRCE